MIKVLETAIAQWGGPREGKKGVERGRDGVGQDRGFDSFIRSTNGIQMALPQPTTAAQCLPPWREQASFAGSKQGANMQRGNVHSFATSELEHVGKLGEHSFARCNLRLRW